MFMAERAGLPVVAKLVRHSRTRASTATLGAKPS
jgi:hypothetical protein